MRASDALERSQKKLYNALKSELALFEKRKPKELRSYERSFRASLPRTPRATKKQSLLNAAKRANVVLVGDFHPFRQSQKGFIRLVKDCLPGLTSPIFALECLQQRHQKAVDEFFAGHITVEELRDEVEFEKHWPFYWDNYREILLLAKQHRIQILALNVPEKRQHFLSERDIAAAERIAAKLEDAPGSTVFVLYGEHHLGRSHLPREIRSRAKSGTRLIAIHQNDPALYWKARKKKNGQRPEVLRLAPDEFCILNAVPWVRLRSFLDWLEGDSESGEWDETADVASLVHHYAGLLAETIGFDAKLDESLEIITPDRLGTAKTLEFLGPLSSFELASARHALAYQRTAYLAERGAILLPTLSTNSLSEAASYLLWHGQRKRRSKRKIGVEPNVRMAQFFLGYLGSKILNPKRKCNEVEDLRELLRPGTAKAKLLAARALSLLGPYLKNMENPSRSKALSGAAEIEAARLAGFLLGDRFFNALLLNASQLSMVREWYKLEPLLDFPAILTKAKARIARLGAPHPSKRDRF